MRGGSNNFTPQSIPVNWQQPQHGQGYGADGPNNGDRNRGNPVIPMPPFLVGQNGRGGFQEPWLPIEERTRGGPWGLFRFPEPHLSPMPLPFIDEIAINYINPRPRQPIPVSPPRFMARTRSMQSPTQEGAEEESRLTPDEQKQALKKLRKEIYNPSPKGMAKKLSRYYSDNGNARSSRFNGKGEEENEDGKKCAVCLDDFEPKKPVTLTPCDHMFHEDCIVPWVKSHGQCPVCRFAICERMRENHRGRVAASSLFTDDFMSILRAMDEAALELGRTYR